MRAIHLLLIVGTTMAMSSCSVQQAGYLTTTPNIAGLSKKGDSRVMGTIGLNHLEAQVALSPVEHGVLLGNFYHSMEGSMSFEGGLGTYFKLNPRLMFEVETVYSNADISVYQQSSSIAFLSGWQSQRLHIRGSYEALAVQGGITFCDDLDFEKSTEYLTLGCKYDFVRYDHLQRTVSITDSNGKRDESTLDLADKGLNGRVMTLAITGRKYFDRFGLMGQFAYHHGVTNFDSGFSSLPGYNPVWLTFGFELALNRPKAQLKSKQEARGLGKQKRELTKPSQKPKKGGNDNF